MSKRRSRKNERSSHKITRRDTLFARPSGLHSVKKSFGVPIDIQRKLVSDEIVRRVRTLARRTSSSVSPKARVVRYIKSKDPELFGNIARFKICLNRKIRKEVLHATGKSGGSVRRPRYSRSSQISCS